MAVLRPALEKYIGKLETGIVDKNISLSVSFMQEIPSLTETGTSTRKPTEQRYFLRLQL